MVVHRSHVQGSPLSQCSLASPVSEGLFALLGGADECRRPVLHKVLADLFKNVEKHPYHMKGENKKPRKDEEMIPLNSTGQRY